MATSTTSSPSYAGYKIYRLSPSNEEQRKTLMDLVEEKNDGVIFLHKFSEWEIGKPVDIMVQPSLQERFVEQLGKRGLTPIVIGEVK